MAEKDVISKQLLKKIALDIARILLHLDIDDVEVVDTEYQRVEERRADLVIKACCHNAPPYLLHFEIQNNNQPIMPWRMLRYRTDITLSHPGFPVR